MNCFNINIIENKQPISFEFYHYAINLNNSQRVTDYKTDKRCTRIKKKLFAH